MELEQGIGTAMVYIADKLGLTLEQVYQVYVHSQKIIALVQLVEIAAYIIGATAIIYTVRRWYLKETKDIKYVDSYVILIYSARAVIGVALLGVLLYGLYFPTIALVCPEYVAVNEMITRLAGIVK